MPIEQGMLCCRQHQTLALKGVIHKNWSGSYSQMPFRLEGK